MNELAKINTIIQKFIPEAPHESLLVLDATTGQNGILQAEAFKEVTPISGIVLTKMDGTSNGGIILAIKDKLNINHQEHEVYLFQEYDLKNKEINYQIINADFLKEMVAVYRPYVVKIFIYLLDKMKWKCSQQEDSYVFTNSEIAKAMGYSETSKSWQEPVRIALAHLKMAGYIDFEEFYEQQTLKNGRIVPVPKKRLINVVDVSRPFKKSDILTTDDMTK